MEWITVKEFEDITYKKCNGVARIAFNRPDVRNAFRPKTTSELSVNEVQSRLGMNDAEIKRTENALAMARKLLWPLK